jgi:hypothetical protein
LASDARGIRAIAIVPANAADIPNIMTQQRDNKMQPVPRSDTALTQVFALENRLADQGDHDSVLDVVIQGIAIGDVFEGHASSPADNSRIRRFEISIGTPIRFLETLYKSIDQECCGVKHLPPSTAYREAQKMESPYHTMGDVGLHKTGEITRGEGERG